MRTFPRKQDKEVQTVENRWEEYVKFKCAIARQRKLISQLVRIIVKDKLEKERLDEAHVNSKHALDNAGDALTNSSLPSSTRHYVASLMEHARSEVAIVRDLCNSTKPGKRQSAHTEVSVSQDLSSHHDSSTVSSNSIGASNEQVEENPTGKSSHRCVVKDTTKKVISLVKFSIAHGAVPNLPIPSTAKLRSLVRKQSKIETVLLHSRRFTKTDLNVSHVVSSV